MVFVWPRVGHFDIYAYFFKNYAEQCSWAQELQLSKFASINQVCKFLVDLDPHWYFGKVVSPNNETTSIGGNGTPKGGFRG